ncbi:zinc finger C2H2 domain-containing protein [Vairimorpha necatrix]|uniref:Zinc finger C2H2 domain-containing protein n=1 Tax=Vairimorpha necatrix TaxID=6039 RepID=A0AAX4JD58_9MICR
MVFCIFCGRSYKTKKAYKSHSESQSHKEKETDLKRDMKKFRKLFLTNLCSFIHRYDDYKDLEECYKSYIKNNTVSFRDVGYNSVISMVKDLRDLVDIKETDSKYFVKAYDRFVQKKEVKKINDSDSEEMSVEDISEYETYSGDQEGLLDCIRNKTNL